MSRFSGILLGLGAAALALTGTSQAAEAVQPPAQAVTPGWHVVAAFGLHPGSASQAYAVAASGPDDAWVTGQDCGYPCYPGLVVLHWNGRQWLRPALPRHLGSVNFNDSFAPVGASSASNAWVFTRLDKGLRYVDYALHWTGSRWVVMVLPRTSVVYAAEVFSPANVWAFGAIGSYRHPKPLELHYNGHRWRTLHLPAAPYDVSAVSASDMWAIGITLSTFDKPLLQQQNVAMHWNGRRWQQLPLPKLTTGKETLAPGHIVAMGPNNVWWPTAVLLGNGNNTTGWLLHWNGVQWSKSRLPFEFFINGDDQDGRGGLWVDEIDDFHHYSGGRWSTQAPPKWHGQRVELNGIAWIPGTNEDVAVGVGFGKNRDFAGVVLRHTS